MLLDVIEPATRTSGGRTAHAIPGNVPSITLTVLVNKVITAEGQRIPEGIYDTTGNDGELRCIRALPFTTLASCVDFSDVWNPAAILVLSLHLHRRRKYANAYELGLLEAGQLLQNISLTTTSAGVAACILGSVFDEPFWAAVQERPHEATTITRYGAPIVAVALGAASTDPETEIQP